MSSVPSTRGSNSRDPLQDIWSLSKRQRQEHTRSWRSQLRELWAEELDEVLQKVQRLQEEKRSLDQGVWESLIASARVVGCTTTGAAMHKQLLQGTNAPRVVMVEEAAEILEAHVLTSLSPRTRQLVMIGDHKQLRPKVECYELSVQAHKGHELNVSLFERLVLAGYPHASLAVQHRMHPEISSLVKPTYPSLQDHPKVATHPPVKGLGSRLVFIDHRRPELQEEKASKAVWAKGVLGAESQSKVNGYEVGMSVAVVRYLLQQGYEAGQLVVLTPYLGQLQELQHELSRQHLQVTLDDADVKDLSSKGLLQDDDAPPPTPTSPAATAAKAGTSAKASGLPLSKSTARSIEKLLKASTSSATEASNTTSSSSVRVATIDNYQGEEADVVIASLVRSNSKGSIGFLREPERINVLMSRARHGMIIIGNSSTLRNASSSEARKHWSQVLDKLEAGGNVFSGLPAVCQQHKKPILPHLDCPEAFHQHTPDGGCSLPCSAKLPCGHACPLRCHAFDPQHVSVRCDELVYSSCERGHIAVRKCCNQEVVCGTCQDIRRVQQKAKRELEELERKVAEGRATADLDKARAEVELEHLQRSLAAMEEARAARKAALSLELTRKKLEKEVALQAKYNASEIATWEAEQRRQSEEELAAMEEAARQEALMRAEEQQAVREAAKLQRQLKAAATKMENESQAASRKLQDLENRRQRATSEAQDAIVEAERGAQDKRAAQLSMFRWKEALSKMIKEGASGVEGFKQLLQSAACGSGSIAALDLAFDMPGMGAVLLSYVTDVGASASVASAPNPSWLARGMGLLKDAKWLDALELFNARLADGKPAPGATATAGGTGLSSSGSSTSSSTDALLAACIALCNAKLDLPLALPLPAPSTTAAAAAAPLHPLHHLALAIAAPSSTAAPKSTEPANSLTARWQQQKTDLRAAGHAVAFLLHPGSAQLPPSLAAEAMQVLATRGRVLDRSIGTPNTAATGGTSAAGAGGGESALKKRAEGSTALLKLFDMVGMREVKRQLLDLKDQVELDKERRRDLQTLNYSVQFYGNPGTGKTVVARIYAELLVELGVLPKAEVEETSGAAMVNGGVSALKEQLKKLEKGGVLFVDEAYQINPKTNPMGAQVLDYLLPEMENRRGKLVVVLAGYQKQMEDLMAYNDGLPSRFPLVFKFADYSDDELTSILSKMLEQSKPRFTAENGRYLRIAARRLGRLRGGVGFGNARAVRNLMEQAIKRQSARVLQERQQGRSPDTLMLTREDLLGPREVDVSSCRPLQQLGAMRGLRRVKESVNTLMQLIKTNVELEEEEQPLKAVCLNRVFLGNPGTGKTTVASIYGELLKELGLLSKGEVVVKNPSDFIGAVLGESEQKTAAILDAALGCVLVIDEAYGLFSDKGNDPFRDAVIDTIVAKVQGVPGDDRCVLLLGYPDEMEKMMRKANPGLARRFQLQDAWHFDDYSSEDLLHIMKAAAWTRYGWDLGYAQLRVGVKVLDKERRKPNFGNAGAVNNLLAQVAQRMEARLTREGLGARQRAAAVPVALDFGEEGGKAGGDPTEIFSDLIGCKQVLDKLREWQATIRASQNLGRDPLESFELNFLFVGAPGTGKTTVARRLGMLFESLGILADSEVVACSASDFVTGYAGQSSGKTREMFDSALGKVLFIDEAYRLNPQVGGPYMSEVLDEIVQLLTEPKYQNKMVVILAGYEAQVDDLMRINPGLKSRFSEKLHFPSFTAGEACQLLQMLLEKGGLQLTSEALEGLPGLMQQLVEAPDWSNGRDVVTWSKRIFRSYALRTTTTTASDQGQEERVTTFDLQESLKGFLATKAPSSQTTSEPAASAKSAGPTLASLWEQAALAPAPSAAPPAAPSFQIATRLADPPVAKAPPAIPVQAPEAIQDTAAAAADNVSGSFGGLSSAFLSAVQEGLESMGYDLTSEAIMQQLAGSSSLPDDLLSGLLSAARATGVSDPMVLKEMVRQWQKAIQEQMELEKELAKKQQRPVWRCAACGRYGCPVAPYIERYEEFVA